jgi:hypothetical protein
LYSTLEASRKAVLGAVLAGAATGASGAQAGASAGGGKWSECPAFIIGGKYALSAQNTSDAWLEGTGGAKPIALAYLSSAALPALAAKPTPAPSSQIPRSADSAKVHVTSEPSGGEIYIDGKFFGNAPSDIAFAPGKHVVRVTLGGKEWTRTVQITGGEIQLRAELP